MVHQRSWPHVAHVFVDRRAPQSTWRDLAAAVGAASGAALARRPVRAAAALPRPAQAAHGPSARHTHRLRCAFCLEAYVVCVCSIMTALCVSRFVVYRIFFFQVERSLTIHTSAHSWVPDNWLSITCSKRIRCSIRKSVTARDWASSPVFCSCMWDHIIYFHF